MSAAWVMRSRNLRVGLREGDARIWNRAVLERQDGGGDRGISQTVVGLDGNGPAQVELALVASWKGRLPVPAPLYRAPRASFLDADDFADFVLRAWPDGGREIVLACL